MSNMISDRGIIVIGILVLIVALVVGFSSLRSTIKVELEFLRKEMRVESAVNGYMTLLAVSRIVNEKKSYTFDEYLKEINKIRKKTETAVYYGKLK